MPLRLFQTPQTSGCMIVKHTRLLVNSHNANMTSSSAQKTNPWLNLLSLHPFDKTVVHCTHQLQFVRRLPKLSSSLASPFFSLAYFHLFLSVLIIIDGLTRRGQRANQPPSMPDKERKMVVVVLLYNTTGGGKEEKKNRWTEEEDGSKLWLAAWTFGAHFFS